MKTRVKGLRDRTRLAAVQSRQVEAVREPPLVESRRLSTMTAWKAIPRPEEGWLEFPSPGTGLAAWDRLSSRSSFSLNR